MTDEIKEDNTLEEDGGLKPNRLQSFAMVLMLMMVLLSFALANLQSIVWISSDWLVSTILPAVVTDATNKARASESLPPLIRNSSLDVAAQLKADDMAAKGYFAHWSPDGTSPWYWFGQAKYTYAHAGENLAVHFTDSTAVVDAWLNSPTHRANIMNGNYREIGIGTAKGTYEGYDTVFVVQMFGTPAVAEPIAAAISPVELVIPEETVVDPVEGEVAGVDTSVNVTDEGTVVYESYAETSVEGAVLAEVSGGEVIKQEPTSFIGKIATSPRLLLQMVYAGIALIIFGLLLSSMFIEWRKQHSVQVAYSAGLFVVMALLFVLHSVVAGGVVIA